MNTVSSRNTKYSKAVQDAVYTKGHATNAELLLALAVDFPDVSSTTIHRSTARLQERGLLALAPPANDGSMRYDANTVPHDHFICNNCGGLRNIDIADSVVPLISEALGGCKITGRLVIHGSCEKCLTGDPR